MYSFFGLRAELFIFIFYTCFISLKTQNGNIGLFVNSIPTSTGSSSLSEIKTTVLRNQYTYNSEEDIISSTDVSNTSIRVSSGVKNRTVSCPSGFSKLGKQCIKTTKQAAIVACPSGYTLSDENTCNRYFSREYGCPTGYDPYDGVCRRTQTASVFLECPDGYFMKKDADYCVKTSQRANVEACPSGSRQVGDTCIIESIEAPETICPAGFTLDVVDCVIEEIYDCTPDLAGPGEQKTYDTSSKFGYHSYSLNTTACETETSENARFSLETARNTVSRFSRQRPQMGNDRQLSKLTSKKEQLRRGILTYTVDMQASDAVAKKKTVVSSTKSTVAVCQDDDEDCKTTQQYSTSTTVTQPELVPTTYLTYENDNSCDDIQQPDTDTIDDSSVLITDEKTENESFLTETEDNCEQNGMKTSRNPVNLTSSIATAPSSANTNYVYEDYVLNSMCSRIRREPAHNICPRGVLQGDVCRLTTEVHSIAVPGGILEEKISPNPTCPPNYSRDNSDSDKCSINYDIAMNFFCPSGTIDLTDRCLMRTSITYVCEAGFELENKSCVQIQFAEPILEYVVSYSCTGKNCDENAKSV